MKALLVAALLVGLPAHAEKPDMALLRLEPLGLDAQRAANLDALFRAELERVAGVCGLAPRPG